MLLNFDAFKQKFSGQIILPADAAYANTSGVFMHTGAPALVVKPTTSEDVISAIQFARDSKLDLSVRSGGHSGPGFGTNTDGMVIDLSAINSVEIIDTERHIVRVGSGAKWIDVVMKLKEHGLALSSGDTKTVGVGGLTLGGGIGWLVRKVGLTIDCLISAEVVTVNGDVLKASAAENQDLFWAIRGGGGNFGIVTYFEFTATPLSKVFAGMVAYSLDELPNILKGWREVMRVAPEELNSTALVMPSFGGNPPGIMIMCCYAGEDEAVAMKAIEPLRKLGAVVHEDIKEKAYADVLEDAHPPAGVHIIAKNIFVKEFSDELIDQIQTLCKTAIPILQIRSLGGAMNRVASDATAFPHRSSEVLLVSPTFAPLDATEDVITQSMKPWESLATFGDGTYANLLSTNTTEDIRSAYPQETYSRLAKIKKQYDPENVFKNNFNIQPKNV